MLLRPLVSTTYPQQVKHSRPCPGHQLLLQHQEMFCRALQHQVLLWCLCSQPCSSAAFQPHLLGQQAQERAGSTAYSTTHVASQQKAPASTMQGTATTKHLACQCFQQAHVSRQHFSCPTHLLCTPTCWQAWHMLVASCSLHLGQWQVPQQGTCLLQMVPWQHTQQQQQQQQEGRLSSSTGPQHPPGPASGQHLRLTGAPGRGSHLQVQVPSTGSRACLQHPTR